MVIREAMTHTELEQLRQVFGAYFHQDWSLYAHDVDGIVDRFIADVSNKVKLADLTTLVDEFRKSYSDESQLKKALRAELWCESYTMMNQKQTALYEFFGVFRQICG